MNASYAIGAAGRPRRLSSASTQDLTNDKGYDILSKLYDDSLHQIKHVHTRQRPSVAELVVVCDVLNQM